jgi:hypothetical protein
MPSGETLKKVLLLTANPIETALLRLQEEERVIREQLRLAGYGHAPIVSSGATRPRDIMQAMLDVKPQVLHFSGHGEGVAGLAFENETGGIKLVSGEALGRLLELFSKRYPVECVLLNACFSRVQAEEIVPHVQYVVGMNSEIGDSAAIEFVVGFYKALGAGEPYDFAFELGCNAIQLAGIPDHLVPVLLTRKSNIKDEEAQTAPTILSPKQEQALKREFDKLERFLEAGWWKEADILTEEVMRRVRGRGPAEFLSNDDLREFPCRELARLDDLWLSHSRGHFGFSVQKAIWNVLGGLGTEPIGDSDLERQFGDRVGWRVNELWLPYEEYAFDLSAPPGHLPRYLCRHEFGWWLGKSCLICTRLHKCNTKNSTE